MKFYDFLIKFRGVDLPIGDLADDAFRDPGFPKNSCSALVVLNYLESRNGVCEEARQTAYNAWKFWELSYGDSAARDFLLQTVRDRA
jgi:uncharacterized protein YozE (UPF0346 family)